MFLDGLDKLDRAIVQLLIGNARMSYSELGERTGISRVAAKMRVRSLEQRGVIEGYTTIVNPQRIGGDNACSDLSRGAHHQKQQSGCDQCR